MSAPQSDALVFFGATGDLAYKNIFPSLQAMLPLGPENLVRGQFTGYLAEPGVKPASTVETFGALKLDIDSWRWRGVPFYIRAGKSLPVTCTEITVRLRQPPTIVAFGMNAIAPGSES